MRRKEREVKNIEEIRKYLDGFKVCRLGLVDGETPYIVPMNMAYVLEDEKLSIYFHCAKEGKKMDLLEKNKRVRRWGRDSGIVETGEDRDHVKG